MVVVIGIALWQQSSIIFINSCCGCDGMVVMVSSVVVVTVCGTSRNSGGVLVLNYLLVLLSIMYNSNSKTLNTMILC